MTPELARRDPFHAVPFELPPGVRALEVTYQVGGRGDAAAPSGAGNVVDIGLLDPRATAFPSREGFRGWSGSARDGFFVAESSATPGYLPGPLPAGTWQVLLGLYRILPGGTTVRVGIEAYPGDRPPEPRAPRPARAPVERGPGWYRGDLHAHTHHSDARGSLADLLEAARRRGLDFLAVTDHNTVSHQRPLLEAQDEAGLTLIPGQELTTYRGHANVLGVEGWVDFRAWDDTRIRAALRDARERGGLRVINHPKPTGCDWEYAVWDEAELFEVWNGPWATRNWVSVGRWHDLLANGARLPAVGGSDRHQVPLPDTDPAYLQVGSPTTWVWAGSSARPDLLAALLAGRTAVSDGPDGPLATLERDGLVALGQEFRAGERLEAVVRHGAGSRLRLLTDHGVILDAALPDDEVRVGFAMPATRFVRAEVYRAVDLEYQALVKRLAFERRLPHGLTAGEILAHDRLLALSSPIYGSRRSA